MKTKISVFKKCTERTIKGKEQVSMKVSKEGEEALDSAAL